MYDWVAVMCSMDHKMLKKSKLRIVSRYYKDVHVYHAYGWLCEHTRPCRRYTYIYMIYGICYFCLTDYCLFLFYSRYVIIQYMMEQQDHTLLPYKCPRVWKMICAKI